MVDLTTNSDYTSYTMTTFTIDATKRCANEAKSMFYPPPVSVIVVNGAQLDTGKCFRLVWTFSFSTVCSNKPNEFE